MSDVTSDPIAELIAKERAGVAALVDALQKEGNSFSSLLAQEVQNAQQVADTYLAQLSVGAFGSTPAHPSATGATAPVTPSPAAETSSVLATPFIHELASAGLTAATNPKLALAQALYPGIPVFGF